MKKGLFFPIADKYKGRLCNPRDYRAETTGKKRRPLKGEWYISGAVPKAYRAKDNLDTSYHIAEIIEGRTETFFIPFKKEFDEE